MSDYAVFKKTATHIVEHLDREMQKLQDLLEDLDEDSDRAGKAHELTMKMRLMLGEVATAVNAIREDDLAEEEDEEEEEEEEEEESE